MDDRACMEGMLAHGNLLVTAWCEDKLVGVARSVTDFHFCCYLSDLAVDVAFQRQGIGKELIRLTQAQLGPRCNAHPAVGPRGGRVLSASAVRETSAGMDFEAGSVGETVRC